MVVHYDSLSTWIVAECGVITSKILKLDPNYPSGLPEFSHLCILSVKIHPYPFINSTLMIYLCYYCDKLPLDLDTWNH